MAHPREALSGRESRSFTVREVEVRSGEQDALTLVGYASVTDSPYTVRDFLGEYSEVVRPGAFAKSIAEQDDVRLLLNHDGLPLARTKSGTLRLAEDEVGLRVEADLEPRSGLVNDVRIAMERGDLDEMSFAFQVTRQEWSPDYSQRDITEVRLFDVSVVTYPANPATSAALRAADVPLEGMPVEELAALVARASERLGEAAAPVESDVPVDDEGTPVLNHLRRKVAAFDLG